MPAISETRQERDEVGDLEGVTNAPQMDVLTENHDIPARPALLNTETRAQSNNLTSNEESVDIIPPAPIRSARSSLHTEDVITSVLRGSSTNDDHPRSSQVISHTLEGISSIHSIERSITSGIRQMALDDRGSGPSYQPEGIHLPRTSTINRRDSSDSSIDDRFRRERGYAHERGRPPERERYSGRDRGPPR